MVSDRFMLVKRGLRLFGMAQDLLSRGAAGLHETTADSQKERATQLQLPLQLQLQLQLPLLLPLQVGPRRLRRGAGL
jgi:hypothetical protein